MSRRASIKIKARQVAGRDIRNSPPANSGSIGIVGDGASGNVIIQNLHLHLQLHQSEQQSVPKGK